MFVFAGLGNPGVRYDSTRHNIGFEVIDQFARAHGISVRKVKHKALLGEGRVNGVPVVLVKPQTYMNLSGESLQSVMNFYKIPVTNLVVIYDDIDLDTGVMRIRQQGGAGTHNGMRSILAHLGTQNFPRVRMGVGKPTQGELADYVLGRFRPEEIRLMEKAILTAVEALDAVICDGVQKAMNQFNTGKPPVAL